MLLKKGVIMHYDYDEFMIHGYKFRHSHPTLAVICTKIKNITTLFKAKIKR